MNNTTGQTFLIVDDDVVLAERLGRALEQRGYTTYIAKNLIEARSIIEEYSISLALIDLKLGDAHGLDVVDMIKAEQPFCRIVMMTAYGNIATAVAAVKAGAIDYLTKPLDADAVEAAFMSQGLQVRPTPPQNPMTAERVRWEHILRIYEQSGRNVSETARRLSMHRRTLQRILAKYAPRDNAA